MKIDLSKCPPGTKFKLYNEKIVTLIGKSFVNDDYVIEFPNGDLRHRNQEGKYSAQSEWNIASVVQPDKYLVSYKDQSDTIRTIVVVDPKSLTTDSFYESIKSVTSGYRQPYDILSWSKIEE
jgi:hypothetical protein